MLSTIEETGREPIKEQPLNFLLSTILINKDVALDSYSVVCPEKNPDENESEHLCELCSPIKTLIKNDRRSLAFQLKQLMHKTSPRTVLRALLKLYEEGKLSDIREIPYFSHLETSHLVNRCEAEAFFRKPGKTSSSKLLNLYQATKNVVSLGTSHPLTSLIIQLWDSAILPSGAEATVTAISEEGTISMLSTSVFLPSFTSLLQCRLFLGGKKTLRFMSHSYSSFLAELVMGTLQIIKNSPQGAPFVATTSFNEKAVPWKTVRHVMGLILSSNDKWKIVPPTNKLCFGSPEEIRFSKEECSIISKKRETFSERNNIVCPRTPPEIPQNVLLPEESALLSTVTEYEALSPQQREPSPKLSEGDSKIQPLQMEYSTQKESSQSPSERVSQQSLIFLLEMVLLNKGREANPNIRCPNSSKDIDPQHVCSFCFFAKRLFYQDKVEMIKQFHILLKYTSKETIASSLQQLPLNRTFEKLFDQGMFSPLDLAYLISLCGIGEDMRLPGKANPASTTDLYLSTERAILGGLEEPLTKIIYNIWKQYPRLSLTFKEKEELSMTVLTDKGLETINLQSISQYFSLLELQLLQKSGEKVSKRQKGTMTTSNVKFYSLLTLITLHILKDCKEALPYLSTVLQEPTITQKTLLHLYSLVLATNPRWKLNVVSNKASRGKTQELGFPKEMAYVLFEALQEFAAKNYISIHTIK
ncbi:hypothetical protein [Chlamydiifrater volucris]|uniref:hypothetical protein n=1 Tax=Chlamydiifrater volucris TaxID=2681470 RepID=UPI0032B2556F